MPESNPKGAQEEPSVVDIWHFPWCEAHTPGSHFHAGRLGPTPGMKSQTLGVGD
jgi:hypothetical protein